LIDQLKGLTATVRNECTGDLLPIGFQVLDLGPHENPYLNPGRLGALSTYQGLTPGGEIGQIPMLHAAGTVNEHVI